MAWTYSDWPTKSTAALQLSQLNLHIQEVADKIGNERSADGYSQGSGSLTTYLSALMTSRERLQALLQALPDLCVVDLGLPDMDGIELVREIARRCDCGMLILTGRGHTDTDVVTFLPKERIVATGDLMESVLSYMGDSYPEEWIATLEKLKQLEFDTVLPGHGVPFKGKERITAFQEYLRDLLAQTNALRRQGVSADEAATKVDLTKHAAMFPQIRAVGVDPAVTRRIYRVAQEPNAGPTP